MKIIRDFVYYSKTTGELLIKNESEKNGDFNPIDEFSKFLLLLDEFEVNYNSIVNEKYDTRIGDSISHFNVFHAGNDFVNIEIKFIDER